MDASDRWGHGTYQSDRSDRSDRSDMMTTVRHAFLDRNPDFCPNLFIDGECLIRECRLSHDRSRIPLCHDDVHGSCTRARCYYRHEPRR